MAEILTDKNASALDEAALRVEMARDVATLLHVHEANASDNDCEVASHNVTAKVAGTIQRLCQDVDALLIQEVYQRVREKQGYPQEVNDASG